MAVTVWADGGIGASLHLRFRTAQLPASRKAGWRLAAMPSRRRRANARPDDLGKEGT